MSSPWSLRCPQGHASLEFCRPHLERPYRCVACGAFYRRRELVDLSTGGEGREGGQLPEAWQRSREGDPHGGPVSGGANAEGSTYRGADRC